MLRSIAKRLAKAIWGLCALLRIPLPRTLLPGFDGPLVSVVMPVYGVEAYVAEAIESVLAQSHRNLELIIIDDGSTDGSSDISRSLARRDPRVTYVRTENGGLATARNRGVPYARGKYLMFVDSDDVLPVDAIRVLARSLETSGSDLATGNVVRIRDGYPAKPSWNQRESHATTQTGITMVEHPLLVRDTTAWNKLFRRTYFDAQQIAFPAGRLYEDMAPITRAFARAERIDVISDVCYRWRIRDEANSITQRRFEVRNITDKVDALLGSLAEIEHEPSLRDALIVKIFEADLWTYATHVGIGDTAFDEQFMRAVNSLWTDELLTRLNLKSIVRTIFYAALRYGGTEIAQPALSWGSVPWQELPTHAVQGTVSLLRPESPDLSALPDAAFDLTRFIQVRSTISDLRWRERRLHVNGWSYLPQVVDASEQIITARLVSADGAEVAVEVQRRTEPLAAQVTRSPYYDLSGAGFSLEIDPTMLADGTWALWLTAAGGGLERSAPVDSFRLEATPRLAAAGSFGPGRVAQLKVKRNEPFAIEVTAARVIATGARLGATSGEIDLAASGARVEALWGEHAKDERWEARLSSDGNIATFTWPQRETNAASQSWRLRTRTSDGAITDVVWDDGVDIARTDGLTWLVRAAAGTGHALIESVPGVLGVTDLQASGQELRLGGWAPPASRGTLALVIARGSHGEEVAWTADAAGRFSVVLALTQAQVDGQRRALPTGQYALRSTIDGREASEVRAVGALIDQIGTVAMSAEHRIDVGVGARNVPVLALTPPLGDDELGPRAITVNAQRWSNPATGGPLQDAVFLSSFVGKTVSCHPGAIGRELRRRGFDGPIYADVIDLSVAVPEDFIPVIHQSDAWYRAAGTSRWIAANTALNSAIDIREGQTYLQTWHGTPLKRIGADIQRIQMSRSWLHKSQIEARDQWTHLLSTSPFTSDIFPRALSFDGPLVEAGSPRLDELARDHDFARDRVRSTLGIPADHLVVLYTPTWRDGGGRSELLDVEAFAARLGKRATLLVRAHPNVLGRTHKRDIEADASSASVRDVAHWPIIEELFSAADVMVTDYSSTMFDFAVTGRPQVMFTPDLARYRDEVRGFYLDFDEWAPGPFAQTSDEVLDLLGDLPALTDFSAARHGAFAERFLPWEDGHAAERVIESWGIGAS